MPSIGETPSSQDVDDKFERIKTYVSGVFWYDPRSEADGTTPFLPAREVEATREGESEEVEIYWLDRLFGDGISLPKPVTEGEKPRALTMVISGPPGSGKSTLAMELCYRLATGQPGLDSAYIAIDGHAPWLRDNGRRLWGKKYTDQIESGRIMIHQYTAKELRSKTTAPVASRMIRTVTNMLRGLVDESPQDASSGRASVRDDKSGDKKVQQVVVIDSLDVVPSEVDKARLFEFWMNVIEKGPRLFIFIIDSNHQRNQKNHEFWEYICDVALRMDRTFPASSADGYMIRTLEIVKARYQQHAWGPQQIKLYEARDYTKLSFEQRRRAYPFRSEGGVFIYPSIHYLLSIYKRSDPSGSATWAATPLLGLNILLGSLRFASQVESLRISGDNSDDKPKEMDRGFPEARCTALVGDRGGHKSRIAVLHIVFQILRHKESGIIVSLRDDVPIVQTMIKDILSTMNDEEAKDAEKTLKTYLDIVYFAPGNITPEEFIHRILLSVLRLKALGRELGQNPSQTNENDLRQKITLLFNSVDGLAPRFPMCAREPLFLAALVHVLSSHSVTSILVGATDTGKTDDYLGLYAIAELIINFNHCAFAEHDVTAMTTAILEHADIERSSHASEPHSEVSDPDLESRDTRSAMVQHWLRTNLSEPHVVIQILRHAGSHPAGSRALVLLIDQEHQLRKVFGKMDLYCVPIKWSPTERHRGNENG